MNGPDTTAPTPELSNEEIVAGIMAETFGVEPGKETAEEQAVVEKVVRDLDEGRKLRDNDMPVDMVHPVKDDNFVLNPKQVEAKRNAKRKKRRRHAKNQSALKKQRILEARQKAAKSYVHPTYGLMIEVQKNCWLQASTYKAMVDGELHYG